MLAQLRTGHIMLNQHLNNIGAWETPKCMTCSLTNETVAHFLLYCRRYARQREALQRVVGGKQLEIPPLLSDQKKVHALLQYIDATGWLKRQFQRRRVEEEGEEEGRGSEGWSAGPCTVSTTTQQRCQNMIQ